MIIAKQISKTIQSGSILYGIQLSNYDNTNRTKQVWKTIQSYRAFQNQIIIFAFDVERCFNKKVEKFSDSEIFKTIISFFNQIKVRPDIRDSLLFRTFFQLQDLCPLEYLDEWTKIETPKSDKVVSDFVFDSENMHIIVVEKTKNKIKKLTSFFKQLITAEKNDDRLIFYHFDNGKWVQIAQLIPEASVLSIKWTVKSGLLHVMTAIGIFIFSVQIFGNSGKHQLLDFIKFYDCRDMVYAQKLGITYYCGKNKIFIHSLAKQINMELNPEPLPQISALAVQKSEKRLYVSLEGAIKIYDVTQIRTLKLLATIQITGKSPIFSKLLISHSQKYLFGLNIVGFISVFQIKPEGKQKLMNVLTNIDCPQNSNILQFNQKNQVIIVSHGKHIVLIDTKNIPLYAGGNSLSKITSGVYDDRNNIVVTGDEDGSIRLYNVSIQGLSRQGLQ